MSEERHILFDMDKTLSDSLDSIIVETSRKTVYGAYRQNLNDLVGRNSCRENLAKVRNTFKQLAEPDAMKVAAAFKKVFDEKKEMAESLDISQEMKDSILFALSVQRKNFGIDHKRFTQSEDSSPRIEIAH